MHKFVPKLSFSNHKGQSGKICVIGGSDIYTGAPYFSGISCLKMGADLVSIICTEEAAIPIKSYSPELMVHPLLKKLDLSNKSGNQNSEAKNFYSKILNDINKILEKQHSVVIGPGLGLDLFSKQDFFGRIVYFCSEKNMPIIIDGDGLTLLSRGKMSIIRIDKNVILTTNAMEFRRLWKSFCFCLDPPPMDTFIENDDYDEKDFSQIVDKVFKVDDSSHEDIKSTSKLAQMLGGVTVVRKGKVDIITNGEYAICCFEKGMPKRCGGQGDMLSGLCGIFAFWLKNKSNELTVPWQIIASYCACFVTKKCARLAFDKKKRSVLTTDLINEIENVCKMYFDEENSK